MSRPRSSWRRTAAFYRAPGVIALAVGFGLATGRMDVVLLAAPLAMGAVLAGLDVWPVHGSRTPMASVDVDEASFGANTALVRTTLTGTDGVEFAAVAQPGIDGGATGAMVVVAGGGPQSEVAARFRTRQWGATSVARPDLLGVGPDGLYLSGPVRRGRIVTELVLPAVQAISPLTLPPITGGWAGAHVSRRPGQGSDLVDLREFAPGDRLRSIHWRAYARHEKLYTRRTLSDADAELMLCLDLSAILVPQRAHVPTGRIRAYGKRIADGLRQWRDAAAERRGDPEVLRRKENERRLKMSSLDLTVSATAAVAAAHLGQGDRVGLVTATLPRRLLRPGAGNRQLQRIRHQLAVLESRRSRFVGVAWWGLRPGQVVVLFSALLDGRPIDAALDCQARGHRVIVVDVLPTAGLLHAADRREADHLRVLTDERELQLDVLRGNGIPVLSYDTGDIALQMAQAVRVMRIRR